MSEKQVRLHKCGAEMKRAPRMGGPVATGMLMEGHIRSRCSALFQSMFWKKALM
jgi:hypothetical protein